MDFVGSLKENYGGMPRHTDFDMDHEGHWGWRADQVLARIDKWGAKKWYEASDSLLNLRRGKREDRDQ